jgi:predicted protein tyrosine phosphatase
MYSVQNELLLAVVGKEEICGVIDLYTSVISNISLISITDPDGSTLPRSIVNKFKNALEISFWDVEEDFCSYTVITPEQGSDIKKFINENDIFLVHCEAGISRSAGVAKAIECIKWFNGDVYEYETSSRDNSIRNHQRYSPNYTVFKTVMRE